MIIWIVIGDKAEQAYRRGDALEKRRALMEAWSNLCCPSHHGNALVFAEFQSQTPGRA